MIVDLDGRKFVFSAGCEVSGVTLTRTAEGWVHMEVVTPDGARWVYSVAGGSVGKMPVGVYDVTEHR